MTRFMELVSLDAMLWAVRHHNPLCPDSPDTDRGIAQFICYAEMLRIIQRGDRAGSVPLEDEPSNSQAMEVAQFTQQMMWDGSRIFQLVRDPSALPRDLYTAYWQTCITHHYWRDLTRRGDRDLLDKRAREHCGSLDSLTIDPKMWTWCCDLISRAVVWLDYTKQLPPAVRKKVRIHWKNQFASALHTAGINGNCLISGWRLENRQGGMIPTQIDLPLMAVRDSLRILEQENGL